MRIAPFLLSLALAVPATAYAKSAKQEITRIITTPLVLNAPGAVGCAPTGGLPSVLAGQQLTPWAWAAPTFVAYGYGYGSGDFGPGNGGWQASQASRIRLGYAAMQARRAGGGGGALGPGNILGTAFR